MGFIVHSMCFVVLLSACYADDSMESTVIRCNHQCSIETVECSANCRMEDVLDKLDVLSCLADCKLKSETCDTTCICLTDCASRMKGCGQLCKSHSFQTSHDRRECYAECSYETEQCRNKCNQWWVVNVNMRKDLKNIFFLYFTIFKIDKKYVQLILVFLNK